MPFPPLALGVLVSGAGTNLQSILDAASSGQIPVEVRVVISNQPGVQAIDRARRANLPAVIIPHHHFSSREAFEAALVDCLFQHEVRWVALAGFMRILTPYFLNAFPDRVLNIHPSLLPAFPGTHAQRQALTYGVKISGCTVHFVDGGTDTGPIIAQAPVSVLDSDDESSLSQRILQQEHLLYPRVLKLLAEERIVRNGHNVKILGEEKEKPT